MSRSSSCDMCGIYLCVARENVRTQEQKGFKIIMNVTIRMNYNIESWEMLVSNSHGVRPPFSTCMSQIFSFILLKILASNIVFSNKIFR